MQLKKSLEASLEGHKLTFALMGLIFVLSFCFVAVEWTQKNINVSEARMEEDTEAALDESVTNTDEDEPEPEKEEEPEPEEQIEEMLEELIPQTDLDKLSLKENSDSVADFNLKAEDEIEIKHVEVQIEETVEDEDVIFEIVETQPEFPGGTQAMYKFLSEHIKYPVIAAENNIQGRVVCQFVINKDGSIVDVHVVRGVDPALDKEAIRVIQSMPKWKPAEQRGAPVRFKFTLPVKFTLSNN